MSKPAFHCILTANTGARRTGARNFLTAQLTGKDVFSIDIAPVILDTLEITCRVRFNSSVDRDSMYTASTTFVIAPGNGIGVGSFIARHLCPHDDGPDSWYDCRLDPLAVYEQFTVS